jgi:hypothetical protein
MHRLKTLPILLCLCLGSCAYHTVAPNQLADWEIDVSGPVPERDARFLVHLYSNGALHAHMRRFPEANQEKYLWTHDDVIPREDRNSIYRAVVTFLSRYQIGSTTNHAVSGGISVDLLGGQAGEHWLSVTDNTAESPADVPGFAALMDKINTVLPVNWQIPLSDCSNKPPGAYRH